MRFFTIAIFAVLAGALPVHAQDRTPPAGSYRALEVPIDLSPRLAAPVGDRPVMNEGRSADEQPVAVRRHRRVQCFSILLMGAG